MILECTLLLTKNSVLCYASSSLVHLVFPASLDRAGLKLVVFGTVTWNAGATGYTMWPRCVPRRFACAHSVMLA